MFLFKSKGSSSSSKTNEADKTLVQRRLFLAENTPEPVFDLSACNLSEVPAGVPSKCRVFRKTQLLLQNNLLKFLPDLRDLALLTVLNVSCNQLRELPDSVGCLLNLEVLDLHQNQLVSLPKTLGKLKYLRKCDVSRNEKMLTLPKVLIDLGENLNVEGCLLLGDMASLKGDSKEKSEVTDDERHEGEGGEDEPDLTDVWSRRERMLQDVRKEMLGIEDRLRELTTIEYEKRDKRQEDQIMTIAQERVELAANLNDLMVKREVQLSDFRSAGRQLEFEESDVADRECVICIQEGLHLVVLMPCGHVCVCRECSEKLSLCPFCRQEISPC